MTGFDLSVLRFVADHRVGFVTSLARGLMGLGTSLIALTLIAGAFAVYVVVARRWRFALAVGGAFVAASLLAAVLKSLIGQARPPASLALVHLAGWSMPSTHAARTAALATAAIATLTSPDKRVRQIVAAVLIAAVILVGAAMVYLGGHWITDVLVGWALGIAIGTAAAFAARLAPPKGVVRRQ